MSIFDLPAIVGFDGAHGAVSAGVIFLNVGRAPKGSRCDSWARRRLEAGGLIVLQLEANRRNLGSAGLPA
jgi:hypothetical protein